MTSITCGSCHGTHHSIDEVKACYNGVGRTRVDSASNFCPSPFQTRLGEMTTRLRAVRGTALGISAKRADFIDTLVIERGEHGAATWTRVQIVTGRRSSGQLNSQQAGIVIDFLKSLPRATEPRAEGWGQRGFQTVGGNKQGTPVESGPTFADCDRVAASLPAMRKVHYAIQEDGVWKFYRVDKPTEGRYAGRTFLDIQASDDYHPIKAPGRKFAVLSAIAKDPEKAVSDYGHQLGRCGVCRRTLTDPVSIERGIGPVCADKAGW